MSIHKGCSDPCQGWCFPRDPYSAGDCTRLFLFIFVAACLTPWWPCWDLGVHWLQNLHQGAALGSSPKPRKIPDHGFSRPGLECSSPQISLISPFPRPVPLSKAVIPRSEDRNWEKKAGLMLFQDPSPFYTPVEGNCELAFLYLVLRGH